MKKVRPKQSNPVSKEISLHLERFTPQVCRTLRNKLIKWYEKKARPLPWRESRDPYRIWISEIMLQQTTVKAVIPYYERFLNRFPTIQVLAAASEEEVLQHWEGLGYYSRGRNIHRSAKVISDEFNGEFPQTVDEIQKLPGIGRYTAGAISSFAFNRPAPIVEANTLRLYCRLLGYEGDPRSKAGQELLWEFASQLQPKEEAGLLNQALMELGSLICTPVSPDCQSCPIREHCVAAEHGKQSEIPVPKVRPEITQTVEANVAIRCENRFLIRQRSNTERWAGMWDFLRFPIESISHQETLSKNIAAQFHHEIRQQVQNSSGVEVTDIELQTEIRHSVTRYRIRLMCCTAEVSTTTLPSDEFGAPWRWIDFDELKSLPMPITGRRFATFLETELTK